jgi:tetratricopeptide (TPR) repeat protein
VKTARVSGQDVARAYRAALDTYRRGEDKETLLILSQLLRIKQGHVRGTLLMARTLVRSGDKVRAMALYAFLIKNVPRVREPWWGLAYLLRSRGRLPEAAGLLSRYMRIHGPSREARRQLASIRLLMGRPGQAGAELAANLEERHHMDGCHQDGDLCVQVAEAYHKQGNLEQAQQYLTKAADLDPLCHQAYRRLAELHRHQGRLRQARTAAVELVNLLPRESGALMLAGEICHELADWDRAVAFLERYLEQAPGDLRVRQMKAKAHFELGELDEAQVEFAEVLNGRPACKEAAWALAQIAHRREDYDLERAHLNRLLLMDASHRQALWGLSRLDFRSARYRDCISRLQKLLLLMPGNPAVLFMLGRANFRVGDLVFARRHLVRVVRECPNDTRVLMELAEVLKHLGDADEALGLYRRVVDLGGDTQLGKVAAYEIEALGRHDELQRPVLKFRRAA